jgi:hypothetical protein
MKLIVDIKILTLRTGMELVLNYKGNIILPCVHKSLKPSWFSGFVLLSSRQNNSKVTCYFALTSFFFLFKTLTSLKIL